MNSLGTRYPIIMQKKLHTENKYTISTFVAFIISIILFISIVKLVTKTRKKAKLKTVVKSEQKLRIRRRHVRSFTFAF